MWLCDGRMAVLDGDSVDVESVLEWSLSLCIFLI